MAFREKSAWISMVVTLLVYGVYFYFFGRALTQGRPFGLGGTMSLSVVGIVILQSAAHTVAAFLSPRRTRARPQDEREWVIQMRATTSSFYLLQVLAAFRYRLGLVRRQVRHGKPDAGRSGDRPGLAIRCGDPWLSAGALAWLRLPRA